MKLRLGLAAGLGLLAACLPELVQHEGEHILYEHSAEYSICAGTVAYLDDLVVAYSEHLNVPVPEQVRYSWLDAADRKALLGNLGEGKSGFAPGTHAISFEDPASTHELVHALVFADPLTPFFNEGLATTYEVLAHGWPVLFHPPRSVDPRTSLFAVSSDDVDYFDAARFTAFLLTRHGHDKLYRLNARLYPPYTEAQLSRAFRAIYDLDFDDEVDHFMRGDLGCEDFPHDLSTAICSAPVLPWSGDTWTFAGFMDCDDPATVGGIDPRGGPPIFQIVSVQIPRAGIYDLDAHSDVRAEFTLSPCFGCPGQGVPSHVPAGEHLTVSLGPGLHQLRVDSYADDAQPFAVTLRPRDTDD